MSTKNCNRGTLDESIIIYFYCIFDNKTFNIDFEEWKCQICGVAHDVLFYFGLVKSGQNLRIHQGQLVDSIAIQYERKGLLANPLSRLTYCKCLLHIRLH